MDGLDAAGHCGFVGRPAPGAGQQERGAQVAAEASLSAAQSAEKANVENGTHRDAQFGKIDALKAEFRAAGNPIISFDTKKKEHLGNLYRAGHFIYPARTAHLRP